MINKGKPTDAVYARIALLSQKNRCNRKRKPLLEVCNFRRPFK